MVKCDIICARSAPEKKSHYFKFEIVLAVFSDNFKYEIIFQNFGNYFIIYYFKSAREARPKKMDIISNLK